MGKTRIPPSAFNVSDEDLWAALSPPEGRPGAEHVAEALELARSGRRTAAYRALVRYWRVSLPEEWDRMRTQALAAPEPDPAVLRDLLRGEFAYWHKTRRSFPGKVQFGGEGGVTLLHWSAPALLALVQRGDGPSRKFLLGIVTQDLHGPRAGEDWDERIAPQLYALLVVACNVPHLLNNYLALINTGDLPVRATEALVKTLLSYGRALDAQLKGFWAHNIQTTGASALVRLARLLPELKESARWDRRALHLLHRQITEGFFADGCHAERVWGYGSITLRHLSEAFDVMRRTGGAGGREADFLRGLRRAYQFYARTLGPGHLMPSYGDASPPHDAGHLLEAGRRFFPEGTGPDLGVDRSRSYCLRSSGFAVLRSGDERAASYVNVSFGRFAGWHSHQDLLSMNFWSRGVPLLEECCRFGPYGGNALDHFFRGPEAHNLLLIDGMVYNCHGRRGREVAWHSCEAVDYWSGWHEAYHYFCYGVRDRITNNIQAKVRRTILMVKDPGYVLVMDSVTDQNAANFQRAITQLWHSPEPFQVLGPDLVRTQGRRACLMAYAHPQHLRRLETGSDFLAAETDDIGFSYDRHLLRARRWLPISHRGIAGFTVLLYPFTGARPEVSIKPLPTEGGGLWRTEAVEVTTPRGRDVIVLNPERAEDLKVAGRPVPARALVELGGGRGTVRVP